MGKTSRVLAGAFVFLAGIAEICFGAEAPKAGNIGEDIIKKVKDRLGLPKKEEPVIDDIEPKSGSFGTKVKIIGKRFNLAQSPITTFSPVFFGNSAAKIIAPRTDTELVVEAPEGKGKVMVKVGSSKGVPFTYLPPVVEKINPSRGYIGKNVFFSSEVTLTGKNFGFYQPTNPLISCLSFGISPIHDWDILKWTDNEIVFRTPIDGGIGLNIPKGLSKIALITPAVLSGNFEAIKFAVELADKIDEATAKTIQRAVNQASKEGQRKVNVVVRTAADESNPVVFTYKTLPPPTWKEVPLTEKKIPSRAAPSKFDRNTILNDSDFDVSNTLSQEKIQELFEKRNSFFKDYIDPTTRKPASWVIADRARHYRISSKILLAKMQAESSSIWNAEMSRKMMERDCYYQGRNIGKGVDWVLGFGWTDAGPIPKYKGFYNQVDGAARLLSVAFAQPEAFTDAKGLKWSVGESHTVFDGTVTPRNRATIALYVYTPSIKANKLFYNVWQMMFGSKLIVQEVTKLKEGLITALIIDKSGSMRGEKIKKAKTAAYIYVDTSQPERDSISLVAFSSNAQSITEPISINQGKEVLKRDILSVDAGGNTNIGSGLTVALSHLSSSDFEDKRAILMSDGRHNTGTYRPEVAEFQRRGWPIYTVAFGADADQETLRWIAEQTGGSFFPAGLSNLGFVYHKIRVLAHNGSVYRSYNDFMRTGQELIYDVPINPDMKRVGFFTNWQGSRMETVLFSPDKTVINRSNVNKFGRFIEGKTYNCFEINNPQVGNWQVQIVGFDLSPQGEQVNFHSFCQSDIFSNILGFQPNYSPGKQVQIGVKLAEVINGRLLPLKGARLTAEIKKPSLSLKEMISKMKRRDNLDPRIFLDIFAELSNISRKISLFDDGRHGDINPGDGIYANVYNDTRISGPYLVTINLLARTSRGKAVRRTLQGSFQVGSIEQNSFTISDFLSLINRQIPKQGVGKGKEKQPNKIIDSVFDQIFR